MGVLTVTEFINLTDDLIIGAQALVGTSGSGLGEGDSSVAIGSDWGLSKACRNLEALVLGWQDYDLSNILNTPADLLRRATSYQRRIPGLFANILRALTVVTQNAGLPSILSIDNFAGYYNSGAGGPWNGLLGPDFRAIYQLVFNTPLSPSNCFSPAIVAAGSYNGTSTPNGMGKLVVASGSGTFSSGIGVDSTKYAGMSLVQLITTGLVFQGGFSTTTITVTGNGLSATGAAVTGHTWTAAVTASGTVTLTPAVAGDILQSVTAIAFSTGSVLTGTFVVQGNIPQPGSGYSNLAASARITPLSTFTIAY